MSKILSKILKNASNKHVGSKEVLKNIDSSKLVICSNSLDEGIKVRVEEICKEKNIPIYSIDNTSRELGRLCNKPFRVSILALPGIEDNDLELLLKEINTS